MKFERANSKTKDLAECSFTVPDRINVKQQLEFYSTIGGMIGPEYWLNMWQGAKLFIQDWHCPLMPDVDTDLESIEDPEIAGVLIWASAQVNQHINGLKSLPKA